MPFHFMVRFEPAAGKEAAFREELKRVVDATRADQTCLAVEAFASLREPTVFAIHSVWRDEAAFERHAADPDTVRFIEAVKGLLTHPIQGIRAHENP